MRISRLEKTKNKKKNDLTRLGKALSVGLERRDHENEVFGESRAVSVIGRPFNASTSQINWISNFKERRTMISFVAHGIMFNELNDEKSQTRCTRRRSRSKAHLRHVTESSHLKRKKIKERIFGLKWFVLTC